MVSEDSPTPNRQAVGARRRVSLLAAIVIVFVCAAVGVALGLHFPINSFIQREPSKGTAQPVVVIDHVQIARSTMGQAAEHDTDAIQLVPPDRALISENALPPIRRSRTFRQHYSAQPATAKRPNKQQVKARSPRRAA